MDATISIRERTGAQPTARYETFTHRFTITVGPLSVSMCIADMRELAATINAALDAEENRRALITTRSNHDD